MIFYFAKQLSELRLVHSNHQQFRRCYRSIQILMGLFPWCCLIFTTTNLKAEIPESIRSFINTYCIECHDAQSRSGGLDLSSNEIDLSLRSTYTKWTRLHDRIRNEEMPPKDSLQPTLEERNNLLEQLGESLTAENQRRYTANGRSVRRRLNRSEFENTLRDLLELPWLEIKDILPTTEEQVVSPNLPKP